MKEHATQLAIIKKDIKFMLGKITIDLNDGLDTSGYYVFFLKTPLTIEEVKKKLERILPYVKIEPFPDKQVCDYRVRVHYSHVEIYKSECG